MKRLFTFAVALLSLTVAAQQKKSVVIGAMTERPNALLIINPPDSDQGVLLPQLSTGQRMSLKPESPSEDGLLVFDSHLKKYYYWASGGWMELGPGKAETAYQAIDPSDFQPLMRENNIRHTGGALFQSDNTFVTVTTRSHGNKIIAPVNLPHGAVVQELSIYYMDNHQDGIKVQFFRKGYGATNEEIAAWESSGASADVRNGVITNFKNMPRIDNENFTYRLVVGFDIDHDEEIDQPGEARQRLYGIRIKYQP